MSSNIDKKGLIFNEKDFYKGRIIEMVGEIDNVELLRFIHRMIKNLIE